MSNQRFSPEFKDEAVRYVRFTGCTPCGIEVAAYHADGHFQRQLPGRLARPTIHSDGFTFAGSGLTPFSAIEYLCSEQTRAAQ